MQNTLLQRSNKLVRSWHAHEPLNGTESTNLSFVSAQGIPQWNRPKRGMHVHILRTYILLQQACKLCLHETAVCKLQTCFSGLLPPHSVHVSLAWLKQPLNSKRGNLTGSSAAWLHFQEWECLTVTGLRCEVLVVGGLQGWLLWEAVRSFPHVW